MEKHCSAWEKWAGRGGATLAVVVSTATDIVGHFFQLLSEGEPAATTKMTQPLKCMMWKKNPVEINNRIE